MVTYIGITGGDGRGGVGRRAGGEMDLYGSDDGEKRFLRQHLIERRTN